MTENIEKIQSCIHAIIHCNRSGLVNEIMEHSEEEFESKEDFLTLAKENDEQLKIRLSDIINYYLRQQVIDLV
jgi:hypothetical protein